MIEEGCGIAQLDKAAFDFGMPMGPITLGDMVGLELFWKMRKAAGNMASRVFAAELKSEGAIVIAMSPGWVATDMGSSGGRNPPLSSPQSIGGMLSPSESRKTSIRQDGERLVRESVDRC